MAHLCSLTSSYMFPHIGNFSSETVQGYNLVDANITFLAF